MPRKPENIPKTQKDFEIFSPSIRKGWNKRLERRHKVNENSLSRQEESSLTGGSN